MGKKNKSGGLGRSLIKDRFSGNKHKKNEDSLIHTSDLNDGYDWGWLNLNSVTEQSSFEDFLSTAQLAGTTFQAEKLNIKIVDLQKVPNSFTPEEREKFEKIKEEKKHLIRIPRRPKWDITMSTEELHAAEVQSFLEWRRQLSLLQEDESIILTPYEKNLEFWRQLWRVVERSDIVVQILDARNPLLFRCEDLETYVTEVGSKKKNFLLLNKADFLSESQRKDWLNYFKEQGIEVAFFSAQTQLSTVDESVEGQEEAKEANSLLLKSEKLLDLLESLSTKDSGPGPSGPATVGLVGYPNVGKSSTINALMGNKKVSVSATPGKTKHFQTLEVREGLVLMDCPGLVMPSMMASASQMLLYGILPADSMKDPIAPTRDLIGLLPRELFQREYGIMVPEDAGPAKLLGAYALSRGFMTAHGQPDQSRAGRYVLKDFQKGRLLHATSPPGLSQELYNDRGLWRSAKWFKAKAPPAPTPQQERLLNHNITSTSFDKQFFEKVSLTPHTRGKTQIIPGGPPTAPGISSDGSKPWKDHSYKRNKHEKLRKVYRHLDQF